MGIDPAMLARPDDPCSNTGQVQGGNRDNQQEPLQSFGCREFAGVDPISARFFIKKSFLYCKC